MECYLQHGISLRTYKNRIESNEQYQRQFTKDITNVVQAAKLMGLTESELVGKIKEAYTHL
jgi:hypothetical protein